MEVKSFFIYLAIMAGSTYLIRVIPFVLIKKEIENKYVKAFLHYIPYSVLTAMTIPVIFTSTRSPISGAAGFIVAVLLAYKEKGLTVVALISCITVFIVELFL